MSLPWRPQWSSDHAALAPDDSLFQEALKKMRAGGAPGTAAAAVIRRNKSGGAWQKQPWMPESRFWEKLCALP